jgi:hypothetical protein
MEHIRLVKNPIASAADRSIQAKFRNVFSSSHIDLLTAGPYQAANRQVCSRMHMGIEDAAMAISK